MTAQALLDRLERVRATGPGRWIARCAGHEDRSPSLSVRELEDGRVLLRCHAGCATADVLAAVGLDWDALFPARSPLPKGRDYLPPIRTPHSASDILRCVSADCGRVAIGLIDMRHALLDEPEREWLFGAAVRLANASNLGRVR